MAIAGLLVPAVAAITQVNFHADARQGSSDLRGLIAAGVVDQNNLVDNVVRDHFLVGLAKGVRGVVGRHDNDNFLTVKHEKTKCQSFLRQGAPCSKGK
jgi:hypothetical protein